MKISLGAVLLLFAGLFSGALIWDYNNIIEARQNVRAAWGQVEANYQRRLDLIPNLVETVRGYAAHEEEIFVKVAQERARAADILNSVGLKEQITGEDLAKLDKSADALNASLNLLTATVENYPQLRAASNFLALQDQLEGTENRIAVSRIAYNAGAADYNTRIQSFPGVVVASAFGFRDIQYFTAQLTAAEGPKVQLR